MQVDSQSLISLFPILEDSKKRNRLDVQSSDKESIKLRIDGEFFQRRVLSITAKELAEQTIPEERALLTSVKTSDISHQPLMKLSSSDLVLERRTITPFSPRELFPLKGCYSFLEQHRFKMIATDSQKVIEARLYPTEKVRLIYRAFQEGRDILGESDNFVAFAERHELFTQLKVSEDTVMYIKSDQIAARAVASIKEGQLMRSCGKQLERKTDYMFVLNENNQLIIEKKKREGVSGRIHHSSLSGGKPVIAAGMVQSSDEGVFVFKNLSGHYQPPCYSLDRIIEWFGIEGVVREDITRFNDKWRTDVRQLTINILGFDPRIVV